MNVVPESSQQPEAPLADQAQDVRIAAQDTAAEDTAAEDTAATEVAAPAAPIELAPPAPAEPGAPLLAPLEHPIVADSAVDATQSEDDNQNEDDNEGYVPAEPLEFIDESIADEDLKFEWFILKVQVNREDSIKDALLRRVKMNGLDRYFKEIVVPTEDVAEFTKTGKRRVVKKKLYPGYILVNMAVNDDSWFMVRETPGIGDFTGSAGKPTPMEPKDVERILRSSKLLVDVVDPNVKTAIPFKKGDRVRVKEGYFQNFEGDVESIDQAHGRVTVMITIFGRPTPVEIEHWQIELI